MIHLNGSCSHTAKVRLGLRSYAKHVGLAPERQTYGIKRRGRRSADTVAEVVAVTAGARIESDLLVQRIEVSILNSAANQYYAVESAKHFYTVSAITRHAWNFSVAQAAVIPAVPLFGGHPQSWHGLPLGEMAAKVPRDWKCEARDRAGVAVP